MKTLDELAKELAGKTPLQQEDLVGTEVELVVELMQIHTDFLSCGRRAGSPGCIMVSHEGESLRKQLLEFSHGDGVRMTTRFTGFSPGYDASDSYHFALVSIVRLNTRDEKEKERREAEQKEKREAEEKRKSSCFVATAAFGSPNPTVFLLQEYRDLILNKAIVGRAAVRFYYVMSPPLARFIEASHRRRFIARVFLGPVVFLARRQLESFRKHER